MGDVQVLAKEQLCAASSPLPASSSDPGSIGAESWAAAERNAEEIVGRIHPSLAAEYKRKEVIEYIQGLVRSCVGCEVFPYGSVPLKTYLPDGDIDLMAVSCLNIEDSLVSDVHTILRAKEHNEAAPFEVKNVHCIDAEVKLVKCIVQNIVVDISFNQLGGLCTLCFLEQIDRLVGNDHLFKRSILLIKAWCYYESRILGAHHGLISTYALETLVLYIFHLFHASLNGPLAVLYRFLDYFSKFDWENYCISLRGPVCKSSLPDIKAEVPEIGGDDLLLSEEFLRNCVGISSLSPTALETNSQPFPLKHLNIIDPLRENNNLGRSVSRGSFYRIRTALKYGARKLGCILLLPVERIEDELNMFFSSTLGRHENTCWSEMQNPSLVSEDTLCLKSSFDLHGDKIPGVEVKSGIRNGPARCLWEVISSELVLDLDYPVDKNAVLGFCFPGNAKELAISGNLDVRKTNALSNFLPLKSNLGTLVLENAEHATHFNMSGLFRKNGKIESWKPCLRMPAKAVTTNEIHSALSPVGRRHLAGSNLVSSSINHNDGASTCSVVSSSVAKISPPNGEKYTSGVSQSLKGLEYLLELSGDYDSHLRNLQYCQLCHGHALSPPLFPSPPMSPQFQTNPCEDVCESQQIKQNIHAQMNKNGVTLGPGFYPAGRPTLSCASSGLEEKKKARGTGTYFPKVNFGPYRDMPVPEKRRNHMVEVHSQLQRHARNNGLAPQEVNLRGKGRHELSHDEFPVLGRGKFGWPDSHQSHLSKWGSSPANDFSCPYLKLESSSLCSQPSEAPVPEGSSQLDSGISHTCVSTPSPVIPSLQSPEPLPGENQERFEEQLYHLKDDDDFPPLSN